MDTTEELGGTYFYQGMGNLTAHELLFWVFVENVQKQLGVHDIAAVAALVLGDNNIPVSGKPSTATPGTSRASLFFRKHLDIRLKRRLLPTLTKYSIRHLKVIMVNNIGVFVGRAVPVVGWVILANDVARISFLTTVEYNHIARGEDKLW
ncbi:STM2901 family protein [Brenneria corticis]|uniref:Uncharacterized protein n=1 Tax=Brenneria corticis TaxID=2173106 RepID=A0A2U1TM55_9GAMM|nr:hypothetical protein [Brenneria sp. CFCC 11842]PWC10503.1 hypothetical protein DDT56_21550 [Brenneria sp. CFCC 11842]